MSPRAPSCLVALCRLSSGFPRNEPYLLECLRAVQLFLLKEVRDRARIPVQKGVTAMGVVDETRTLRAREVFLQVHRDGEEDSFVVQVSCLAAGKAFV